jgi:hypothetical protein
LLRPLFASIHDVRFNSIRFAQGQAGEPELRAASTYIPEEKAVLFPTVLVIY